MTKLAWAEGLVGAHIAVSIIVVLSFLFKITNKSGVPAISIPVPTAEVKQTYITKTVKKAKATLHEAADYLSKGTLDAELAKASDFTLHNIAGRQLFLWVVSLIINGLLLMYVKKLITAVKSNTTSSSKKSIKKTILILAGIHLAVSVLSLAHLARSQQCNKMDGFPLVCTAWGISIVDLCGVLALVARA